MIKIRCWNNDLKEWDKCAYPIFKGMNPCEVIGFQDNEGSDKLIEDGHDVVLYTGVKDKNGNEIYQGDILEFTSMGKTFREVIEYSEYAEWCVGFQLLNKVFDRSIIVGSIYNTDSQ